MTIVAAGRDQVDMFRWIVLAKGLELYAKTKIRPNRMWPPRRTSQGGGRHSNHDQQRR